MKHRDRMRLLLIAIVALAFGASASAASGSTTALWHMDETSGTTMHDSAGSNNGTLKNVKLGQAGVRGKAYSFNGSSSIVTVPSKAALNPGANDFSFVVNVKFSQVPPGDYDLLRKGLSSTAGGDYKMEVLHSGKAMCHFEGSSGSSTKTAGPNLADGSWHTITCKKTASQIILTVDGASYPKSATVGAISNGAVLTVGAKSSGGDWYKGLMDEVTLSR
jgi:hypothetical protein